LTLSPKGTHRCFRFMQGHAPKPFRHFLSPVVVWRHLAAHAGLARQFTVRTVEMRHKGSHLGMVWMVLLPLLMMGLYTFVFGVIFNGKFEVAGADGQITKYSGASYALGVFLSLTIFNLFSECLSVAPGVIVGNANYVKKVVFPLEILPLAQVGSAVWHFCVTMVLVFLAMLVLRVTPTIEALWFPLIIAPLFFFAMGVSWFFAALGVFLRDVAHVMGFVSVALMYASTVFYSASMVPWEYMRFLRWNPLVHILENSRRVLIWHLPPDLTAIACVGVASLVVFFFGFAFFKKMEPAFADVI
jgi:lipopolysaccharide transport system permease protein